MAVIDVDTIKSFLRLDADENISLYADTAEQYFADAVGVEPDPTSMRDTYVVCAITQELYDNRSYVVDDPTKDKLRHVIRSMLAHARLDRLTEEGELDES